MFIGMTDGSINAQRRHLLVMEQTKAVRDPSAC